MGKFDFYNSLDITMMILKWLTPEKETEALKIGRFIARLLILYVSTFVCLFFIFKSNLENALYCLTMAALIVSSSIMISFFLYVNLIYPIIYMLSKKSFTLTAIYHLI